MGNILCYVLILPSLFGCVEGYNIWRATVKRNIKIGNDLLLLLKNTLVGSNTSPKPYVVHISNV